MKALKHLKKGTKTALYLALCGLLLFLLWAMGDYPLPARWEAQRTQAALGLPRGAVVNRVTLPSAYGNIRYGRSFTTLRTGKTVTVVTCAYRRGSPWFTLAAPAHTVYELPGGPAVIQLRENDMLRSSLDGALLLYLDAPGTAGYTLFCRINGKSVTWKGVPEGKTGFFPHFYDSGDPWQGDLTLTDAALSLYDGAGNLLAAYEVPVLEPVQAEYVGEMRPAILE